MSVTDRLPQPMDGSDLDADHEGRLSVLETPTAKAILGTLAWTFVFLAAFADLFTTVYGLEMGARETNPHVRQVLFEQGLSGVVLLKFAAIGVVVMGSVLVYALERRFRDRPPVWWLYYPALAGPIWMGAAAWNALQITGVIG